MEYSQLISIENIFQAWDEFKKGKRKKYDVQVFERNLEGNLFHLHGLLKSKTYKHGFYSQFYVNDPKRRHIHKAQVSDRIVHHLLYRYLYPLFDKTFIYDSYSCRREKGTHRAVKRLEKFSRKLSRNYHQDFWALKLDIKKFFASVDHEILLKLIKEKVNNQDVLWLISLVINSFSQTEAQIGVRPQKGIPLGNLTSQIFANIYMNGLDQFVKHKLKVKYYLRYADDFIILNSKEDALYQCINTLKQFLNSKLKLELHPNKTSSRKLSWGIDFCGYVVLPYYILPRTKTKRRIFKTVTKEFVREQQLQSYLGYFSHANAHFLTQRLKNQIWFRQNG